MTPKGKTLIPHLIDSHSFDVILQPDNEDVVQLSFFVGEQDVHYVLLPRAELKKLGREIAQLLKE